MYSSQTDLNRPFPEYPKEETDLSHQMSSGLLRYRSAPTSLFGGATETIFRRSHIVPSGTNLVAEENVPTFSSASSQMLYQQHLASSDLVSPNLGSNQINKNRSNLIRQSSSPAGLFDQLNSENGFGGRRLNSQMSFSSMMSQISEENEDEATWEETGVMPESYFSGGIKKSRENETQKVESRNGLTHQFSLPKTSSEMTVIDKFLQFQDSVPCKIRAKRGCATHPRSIAERVRRTRISERMRKLQELVPNMDKQTNTADMLDLAVDYIKELQNQVKNISSSRANCTCSSSKRKS